jgi:uncharacterized protein (DUF2147 family)
MKARTALVLAAFSAMTTQALSDPIEGTWKRPTGVIVAFAKCGAKFCATAKTGPNAGKSVGTLAATAKGYKGSLTDPTAGKTYSGTASISGGTLKVSGCVLGFLCKSENWARQ